MAPDRLGRKALAIGPWDPGDVEVSWREDPYEPDRETTVAADVRLQALRDRGSPSHDGFAARLASWSVRAGRLRLELQPIRWALRLVPGGANGSLSAMCVVRDADGRWLAGHRAMWVATWRGRWTLGAAGAVEVDENPAVTLVRELDEEWSVQPARMQVEALVRADAGPAFLVGQAWLARGVEVTVDPEHDAYEWWPANPERWPDYAEPELQAMAAMLCSRA